MTKSLKHLSFKTRLLLTILSLVVAGLWLLALRVSSVMQGELEQTLAAQMTATVDYVATDLDSKIQLRQNMLHEIATTVTPAMLADTAKLQANLQQQKISRAIFPTGIFLVSGDGVIVAEQPKLPTRLGSVVRDRPYFKEAMATGLPVISEPRIGAGPGNPVVVLMTVPVKDASGSVLGFVAGSMYPSDSNLFGQIGATKLGNTGYFFVVSPKDRLIVAATDPKRVMQSLSTKGLNTLLDRRVEQGYEGPGVSSNSQGIETFTVSRNMKTTGWFVLAGLPTAEAFAPIAALRRQVYVAALLMTVILVLVLRYVLVRQWAPIDKAGARIRRMTEGKEPFAPIPIERRDEIGTLIDDFNQLIVWRKVTEHQMEHLAHHDALTGLPNRLLVQDRFDQARANADRAAFTVALLFLDLDSFKTINDSLGHTVGDALLKHIATRLAECVRDTDTISRQGGDEFLIVLPTIQGTDDTALVLAKLLERLSAPIVVDGHELSSSVSIGVAIYPDDGPDFDTLLKKADMAMYRAKDAGRNTYRYFDAQMNVEAVEHLALRNDLRRALERDEFVLHYQPQLDLATGRVVGVEALIRWNHPDRGLVAPGHFIPVAEESGLIIPISEWVIGEACRQAVLWRKAGLQELLMAVNLSAVQFRRGDVERTVVDALEASGLNPQHLELELTESTLIHESESVLATVQRLKQRGVKFSIDDFGTGYSSLSYLKRFAIDKLKIDQSFIRDLAVDPDDAAIVRAIIQMAHSLGLKTIAEGVETAEMLAPLRIFGCDEVQGYYFARPMPAWQLEQYLRDESPRPL
jgi:diguanylate cyclase (GGDEF)-like protein